MKDIAKSFLISLSIYSRIPVPVFPWEDKHMRYTLCFFPLVGGVIGVLMYLWGMAAHIWNLGDLARTTIGTAIPILVSGGFHVDGFVDSMDAFCSYQSRDRKLEIMKDSHVGAFGVILLLVYYMIYMGAFSELGSPEALAIVAMGFFLSRALSGACVVTLRPAKEDGLLHLFARTAEGKWIRWLLYGQVILCGGVMVASSPLMGGMALAAALASVLYYRWKSYHEVGGITGDLAGYFVTLCEGAIVVAVAIGSRL